MKATVISKFFAGSLLALSISAFTANASDGDIAEATYQNVSDFSQFKPRPSKKTRLDYRAMDEALSFIVIDLGPSLRNRMSKAKPRLGTRLVHGHTSPYRMEGSRITFDYMTDSFQQGFSDYRKELERIGTEIDITKLSRDEQLAYWLNLHNLTLLEQISIAYPVSEPSRIKVNTGLGKAALDDAKIINVKGVALSLRDIRENIVYKNWKDPRIVYGFYRGDIGSPKINRNAFTSDRLDFMLSQNAGEFINSLRGFRVSPAHRHISQLYKEMKGTFFTDFDSELTEHLIEFAEGNVLEQIKSGKPFKFDQYEEDIADLSNGHRLGSSGTALAGDTSVSQEIQKFLAEAAQKRQTLVAKGLITPRGGYVIIEDLVPDEDKEIK